MYWSGVQSTGAEMRKYLTGFMFSGFVHADGRPWSQGGRHTIVDLLKSYLSILRQALLGFIGEHEGLGLLRRGHGSMSLGLGIHGVEGAGGDAFVSPIANATTWSGEGEEEGARAEGETVPSCEKSRATKGRARGRRESESEVDRAFDPRRDAMTAVEEGPARGGRISQRSRAIPSSSSRAIQA